MTAEERIEELAARVSGLQEALSVCVRVIVASFMVDNAPVPAALRAFQTAEADAEAARIRTARREHLSVVRS